MCFFKVISILVPSRITYYFLFYARELAWLPIARISYGRPNSVCLSVCPYAIMGCDSHFKSELRQNGLQIDQDNLRMQFSALNVDFSSLSPDHLGSWWLAHAGVKEGYPSKKWLFIRCWLV